MSGLPVPRSFVLIARYTRPAMGQIWSEESKYRNWLRVELAATDVLSRAGIVPAEAATTLREKASFTVERIHAIEAETRHDVLAFTQAVAESVGPEARWLHFGLTSTDVVDTAQALAFVEASALIRAGIVRLIDVLQEARSGVQRHAVHRPHARRPRRADLVWVETPVVVFGDAAQPATLRRRCRRPSRRKDFGRGRQLRTSFAGT